mmetsp:Transcript_21817/g.36438  ORF Transcript_21817/g.36438 Transcript_21817/m.36438 type:complete len:133 (+) Transcript_21817:424-822(+)
MQGAPGGQKIKRKVSCMQCYGFFVAREGAMCKKTWCEFCSEDCLLKYSKLGTNRTEQQLGYAQSLLRSVETRPNATSGVPTGIFRSAKSCASADCQKRITSMIHMVGVPCNGGSLFYCSKACVPKEQTIVKR